MASSSVLTHPSRFRNDFSIARYTANIRGSIVAAIAAVVIIPVAIQDYRMYLSYGPGGLPYNAVGWLVTNLLRLLSREQLSARPYQDPEVKPSGDSGLLPPNFPSRDSSRPRLGPHPVPQRQLSQLPDVEMRQKLTSRFEELGNVAQQRGLVEIKQSLYERHHSALFVSEALKWRPVAQQTRGEISHVHVGKDGSIHVVLHPKDCEIVLEKGWGQRHALSGASLLRHIMDVYIPVNYVFIYAPRNEAEIEVAMAIVKASIQFMTESRDQLE
jgi:hypothetical protein